MFSFCTLQSQQVWGAVSQLTTLVNNLRTSAQGVIQRSQLSTTPSAEGRSPRRIQKPKHHQNASAFADVLENLPANLSLADLFPLDGKQHRSGSDWSKSLYTSRDTFFENKTGYNGRDDSSQMCLRLAGHVLSSPQRREIYRAFDSLFSTNQMHSRGFKTHRSKNPSTITSSTGQGQGQTVLGDIRKSVYDRFPGVIGRDPGGANKLKTMLADASPELQDKIKVAFAEGYAAHGKEDGESKNTIASRLLKFVYILAFVWLIIQAIQIIGGVASGSVGGLGVLNRDRYEINPEDVKVNFDDVKGVDEAKQELQDIVDFLKDPDKFTSLGAKLPRGVLLVGQPGIGKTLLARAVAGEAGVPFFQASGSEFDEMFVGTGAKRVRQLFAAAKARSPCVIFIDEIDTVGAKRTNSQIHPYANQTINQLLSEMDGFKQNEGVIVLGATNRRDNLDKALLRPGRFDVEVQVFAPDVKGRREILQYYLEKIVVDPKIDIDKLAHGTYGFTGADLENMVNQAALKAAMDYSPLVTLEHLDYARDKVLMGPAKKSKIPDESTNWVTAYHEAGHTLVAYFTKHSTPLHKVTIIPRGSSLGHTAFIPDHEVYGHTKAELLAQMDVGLGGRVGEEIIYGRDKITTGAGSDFTNATAIATGMVKKWGMSDKVGVRVFSEKKSENTLSQTIQEQVDAEIKRLLQESYERAYNLIKSHANEHKALAQALIKYETLDAKQIATILDGGTLS